MHKAGAKLGLLNEYTARLKYVYILLNIPKYLSPKPHSFALGLAVVCTTTGGGGFVVTGTG